MQSVNKAKFSNINFLLLLLTASPVAVATDIVPSTSMCVSLELHKIDFNVVVLNLIWLLVLYLSRESSLTSSHFFILKFYGWCGALSNEFIIILILHYYIIILILDQK